MLAILLDKRKYAAGHDAMRFTEVMIDFYVLLAISDLRKPKE